MANYLADTLTSLIRNDGSGGGDNSQATVVQGPAFAAEQFVVVCWQWLILPVLDMVLAPGSLIVTIAVTSAQIATDGPPQPRLKTSVLAYLLYPLSGWAEEEVEVKGKQTDGRLEGVVRGMTASFRVDDDDPSRRRLHKV